MCLWNPTVDITGNWRDTENWLPHIQTREPWLLDGKPNQFQQNLNLLQGNYTIRFEYDRGLDKKPGWSLNGVYEDFQGFQVDGVTIPLCFLPVLEKDNIYQAECEIEIWENAKSVQLELHLLNTRVMRTWIIVHGHIPSSQTYQALPPAGDGEYMLVRGIPFMLRKFDLMFFPAGRSATVNIDRGSLAPWQNGMEFDCHGAEVNNAHFLGMIHNIDIANGSWSSPKGDHGYSHFVGDQAGEVTIEYMDHNKTIVPLIFGFNVWYSRPWDILWHYSPYQLEAEGCNYDDGLFLGHNEYRDLIQDAVSLVDGVRIMGSSCCNARFVFSLNLAGSAVRSITVKGAKELYGHPVISAITLDTTLKTSELMALPDIFNGQPCIKPVTLDDIDKKCYLPGITKLMKLLYTFVEDLPKLQKPEIPDGYFGPDFDFTGAQEAIYAATFLYRNGPECGSHIADSGTECCSSTAGQALAHYTLGMGVWREWESLFGSIQNWFKLYQEREPGNLPGRNSGWTRAVGELLRESMAFGYDKFINRYIDWLDSALFAEAQPPHWNRVAGEPDVFSYRIIVGEMEERGNRENDGHGICMWGRYMVWHWLGRPKEWNETHWKVTESSVEWIKWQLDNDVLRPGVRKDVLYTESECAYGGYDIYSSFNCLHGIKLAIRMAEQLGKSETIERWNTLYQRLRQGILDHLVDDSDCGEIWHTESNCEWQDHAHKLPHLHLATEGDTYTPLQDYMNGDNYDRRYLEIDRNTYRYLMKDKNYNCVRMYGYGQGMMTQAALLLDEMNDATRFMKVLLTHCYLPEFEGWACPEGIIVHRSGQFYLPVNAYLGQDAHLADATKAVRLMLGIDDNNPEHLRLVPRYPAEWTRMSISRYPVLTGETRQLMEYIYERKFDRQILSFKFERSVEHLSVRFGPLEKDILVTRAYVSGSEVPFEITDSGDGRWVWVRDISGIAGNISIEL